MQRSIGFFPLCFLFLGIVHTATAQHAFTIAVPGIGTNREGSAIQTPDGGFVLLVDKTFKASKKWDLDTTYTGLVKLSSDGLIEWSRYVDIGAFYVSGASLLQTPDGGFIALANMRKSLAADYANNIALLRFNAHGYLLWAKQYNAGTDITILNGILLANGNLLVSASVEDSLNTDRAQGALIVLDMAGEVVRSERYPAMNDNGYCFTQLRPLQAGNIALVGSINDTLPSPRSGMACILDPDGSVREGVMLNYDARTIKDEFNVADILPNGSGGYILLAYTGFYGCYYSGMTVECDANWDTLRTVKQFADISLITDRFFPAEKGMRTMGTIPQPAIPPVYILQDLDEHGRRKSALQLTPFPIEESEDENNPDFQSAYQPTDDQGMLIYGTKYRARYDEDYLSLNIMETTAFIIRLPFDLMPCSGTSESLNPEENRLKIFAENAEAEEEASEEGTPGEPSGIEGNFPAAILREEERETEGGTSRKESRPFIEKLDLRSVPLSLTVENVRGHRTVNLPLEAQILCREEAPMLSSVRSNNRAAEGNVSATVLLSPNSLRAGEGSMIAFALSGTEKPDITLLTVATGGVVRHLESNAVTWSQATAQGSAWLETDGLAAGVYLVRVRSGERQVTAKLEIR